MPQIINSGSKPPSKKSSGNALDDDQKKQMAIIAACVIAVLIFCYAGYATFFPSKPKSMIADTDKVAPPPGYPDRPPYNMKLWQEGKIHGAGFPLPPSMGGKPPTQ